jgi:membrane protein
VTRDHLRQDLDAFLTPEVADAVAVLAESRQVHGGGFWATWLGLIPAAYAALQGVARLQSTLNMVWGVRAVRGPGLAALVRRKLLAFASIALCGALLLASVGLGLAVQWLTGLATGSFAHRWWWSAPMFQELSTFSLSALLLVIVYKTLPDARIRWRDVLVGALFSAALFLGGKHVVGWYLHQVGVATSWGAASAVVAVLLYAQYVAQVVLFGAEFTFVFARWSGQPIRPGPGAARVVRTVHEE